MASCVYGDPVNIIHKVTLYACMEIQFGSLNNVCIKVLMYGYIQLSTAKAGSTKLHTLYYMTSDMCTASVHHTQTKQWTNSAHGGSQLSVAKPLYVYIIRMNQLSVTGPLHH